MSASAAVSMSIETNPYRAFSSSGLYTEWSGERLAEKFAAQQKISPLARRVHEEIREHITAADFSCIGAKAAINGNFYRFGFYSEMNAPDSTAGLAHDLWEYAREQKSFGSNFATFIASFAAPVVESEKNWENMLWTQLQKLHELDSSIYKWDPTVSSNPEEPGFSFSFAETGFFIVGLHPASSRIARRFPWATLVFNTHAQFERLREQNQFDRMRRTIRDRDLKLQGSLNPNLSDFGDRSEARQYSGRAVEEDWKCPFHVVHKEK